MPSAKAQRALVEGLQQISKQELGQVISDLEGKCSLALIQRSANEVDINLVVLVLSNAALMQKKMHQEILLGVRLRVDATTDSTSTRFLQIIQSQVSVFLDSICDDSSITLGMESVAAAYDQLSEALNDADNPNMVLDTLVGRGTNDLLDENCDSLQRERYIAKAVLTILQYDVECVSTQFAAKLNTLAECNRRDLLKFFRKKTSCSCLNALHKQARVELPKVGRCAQCHLEKERASSMMCVCKL